MDIEGLERLLARIETGDIRVVACDLTQPSPLALEVLSARPYAFLDDAPLEERRTQAVMARRWQDPESASDLGRLDPEAIIRVRGEAWPDPVDAEELHDALLWIGCLTQEEVEAVPAWSGWLAALAGENRATQLITRHARLWVAAERLSLCQAIWPDARRQPDIAPPAELAQTVWSQEQALVEILRGRLEGLGPVTQTALAAPLGLEPAAIGGALAALEVEGSILRGRFIPGANDEQWCDRRLLARIHRYTIGRLRAEIEPVAARDFLRFLFAWQHLTEETRLQGPDALAGRARFARRVRGAGRRVGDGDPAGARRGIRGRAGWTPNASPAGSPGRGSPRLPMRTAATRRMAPVRTTPIALLERRQVLPWMSLRRAGEREPAESAGTGGARLPERTGRVCFSTNWPKPSGLLRPQLEEALGELRGAGLVTSDSFGGLRALLVPSRAPQADCGRETARARPRLRHGRVPAAGR